MRVKQASNCLLALAAGFLISCDMLVTSNPPYVITKPVCEIGERPGLFTYAGIVFKFLNTSEKDIDNITVSFMLFDAQTQGSPFIGSNIFKIKKLDAVQANENKEIVISLDKYMYIAPSEPYIVDFFYIAEIQYADGSTWEDANGIYRVE
jgi:hypothetical protein